MLPARRTSPLQRIQCILWTALEDLECKSMFLRDVACARGTVRGAPPSSWPIRATVAFGMMYSSYFFSLLDELQTGKWLPQVWQDGKKHYVHRVVGCGSRA